MKYFAVLIMVLSLVCCTAAEEAGKGWLQFDLHKTQVGMATIYYDPIYEGKVDLIKSSFEKFLDDYNTSSILLAKKEAVIKDINELLGETEPDLKMQSEILERFTGIFKNFKEMSFYVVSGEKTKDFLRKGGKLPDMTYDKQDDMCEYKPYVGMERGEELTTHLEFALPVRPKKEFEEELSGFIKAISIFTGGISESAAIHEVAEITLIRRVKTGAPYIRWFSDGVANTLTIEILKRHVSEKAAEKYLKDLDISRYKDISKEVNLLYWISATYSIKSGAGSGLKDEISFPRYCFATYEIRRLVEKHGIGCIKDIMDAYSSAKERDGKKLLSVVKEVTDEDMTERLKAYQTFKTREEGMEKYGTKVNKAMDSKDAEDFIANALRMLEMYDSPFNYHSLVTRKMIAQVLAKSGKQELGDKVMKDLLEMLDELPTDKAKELGRELFIDYALNTGRPEIAVTQAEETLKTQPDNIEALGIKMFMFAKDGKMLEAEPFAEKILKFAKKENRFYGLAQKVIMLAGKNKPKVIR